jgi:hypothetical protein
MLQKTLLPSSSGWYPTTLLHGVTNQMIIAKVIEGTIPAFA